ncbi:hypothetical protein [Saccharopolyspora cebuensis]|uniref:Uncharacterized protein n=1 Tax=Saccharopolyspora cebuensis TaxID=418759 RepID=A0ABV4CFD9_9PSEU
MEVHDFDDRDACELLTRPTFMVEQWSWELDGQDEPRRCQMKASVLTGCDVQEALDWCERNRSMPGSFVLYAGTWTTLGYFSGLWLAGEAPTRESSSDDSAATVSFTI